MLRIAMQAGVRPVSATVSVSALFALLRDLFLHVARAIERVLHPIVRTVLLRHCRRSLHLGLRRLSLRDHDRCLVFVPMSQKTSDDCDTQY